MMAVVVIAMFDGDGGYITNHRLESRVGAVFLVATFSHSMPRGRKRHTILS
jgi:hypothetical protein